MGKKVNGLLSVLNSSSFRVSESSRPVARSVVPRAAARMVDNMLMLDMTEYELNLGGMQQKVR
jgi:hypothetical protein